MKINFFYNNRLNIFLFLISLVAYHFAYGLHTLVPTNIGWLLNAYHDWGQHYLGAAFYRQEDWHFPIGQMNSFYYPVGTNVGFTDCTPIMALITKIFSFLLPEDFQYFGIWLLSCMFLNAYFLAKILKLYKANLLLIIFCCTIILINPLLLFRGMQASACAHWLFLGSFYYYLKPTDITNVLNNFKKQGILMLLSSLINPYLAIMTAGFVVVLAVKNYFYDRSLSYKKAITLPVVIFALTLLIWILFGMIEFSNKTDLDVGSIYGTIYSFNLNSFINSYGFYSKFIPQLGMVDDTQHEGFAYLGLGMIILVLIAILTTITFFFKKKINNKHAYLLPLFILCFLMLVFAITNTVTLGTEVLFNYPTLGIIKKAGNIFRATGRFSWPMYYLLYTFAFVIFSKIKFNSVVKYIFLFSIVCFQLYDTENLITSRNLISGGFDSKLDEEKWKLVIDNFDEILVYPPYINNMVYKMDYQDLMFVALKSKKPISIGYVARENVTEGNAFKDTLTHRLKAGEIQKNQLYVTNKENLKYFDVLLYKDKIAVKKLDGFFLIYAKDKVLNTEYVESKENLRVTDSLKNYYKNISQPNINSFKGAFKQKENIQLNLEFFKSNEDVIQASGWAFIKNSKDNTKDTISIALFNKENCFLFKTNNLVRGDISAVYNAQLDNSGFNTTFFVEKLPKATYQIGIVIKNSKGDYYFSQTDKTVEIGNKAYKDLVVSNTEYIPTEIIYNLESISIKKGVVKMNGWAAIKNKSSESKTLKIILINKNKYELETDMIIRNDVTSSNENKFNYSYSGFELQFKQKNIPKGSYKIGILIKDETTGLTYYSDLDKFLNF
jgi:hypothetical protein